MNRILGKLLIGLLLAAVLGWMAGHPVLVTSAFLVIYLGWNYLDTLRLYHAMENEKEVPLGRSSVWSPILEKIRGLQNQKNQSTQQYLDLINNFEDVTRALPDALVVIGAGNITRWHNPSAAKLLSFGSADKRGQNITGLIREPVFANWLEDRDDDAPLIIQSPMDNTVILKLIKVQLQEDQTMLILRDVTEIHNTERLRRELIANISHELRTPLTVLLGYLEVLKSQPQETKPKAIKRMLKQARQMNALLEDLLELSRLQGSQNQEGTSSVDVPALLTQLKEQAEDLSLGRHQLHFDITPGLCMRGIETDLKSAFQNLLVNAINYTPEGGVIRVSWQETPAHLVLSVRDNGIGIPYQDIPHLTERFYRVGDDRNRKTGGTGLGLAIVKHVLANHDAQLDISSELSKGSEFRCLFPLSRKS